MPALGVGAFLLMAPAAASLSSPAQRMRSGGGGPQGRRGRHPTPVILLYRAMTSFGVAAMRMITSRTPLPSTGG